MIEIIDDVVYGTIGFIDGIRGFFQTIADGLRSLLDQGVKGAFILIGIMLLIGLLFEFVLSCDGILTVLKVVLSIATVLSVLVGVVWIVGFGIAFVSSVDVPQLVFAGGLLFAIAGGGVTIVIFIIGD